MWLERGDVITFKKQDPDCEPLPLGIPNIITGVAHFTHGIVDMTFLKQDGSLIFITTNTRFIKKVE